MSHLDPAAPCEVVVGVELLFQLQRLVSEAGNLLNFVLCICICLYLFVVRQCVFWSEQVPGVSLSPSPSQSVGPGK